MKTKRSTPQSPEPIEAPGCILIVEDDPFSMKLYRDLITSRGYQILSATDGETGLDLAREHHPDLILLDVRLPALSGIEVARMLKSDERTSDIPILVISSWPITERAARANGGDAFLAKPVSISALWNTIECLLLDAKRTDAT